MEKYSELESLREIMLATSVTMASQYLEIKSERVYLMDSGQELNQSVLVCLFAQRNYLTAICNSYED